MNNLSSILKFIAQGGLWSLTYPVGSYYETSNTNFNPNTAWGGTWVLDSQGRVTVCAGSNAGTTYQLGATGGSKDAVVPYHNHSVGAMTISGGNHEHVIKRNQTAGNGSTKWSATGDGTNFDMWTSGGGAHSHSVPAHNTNAAGTSGNTVNANMQPYIVVNRWHRTA